MGRGVTMLLVVLSCLIVAAQAQCPKDNRSEPHGGILVTDFTVSGTTTLTSDELARLAGDFIGVCYNDDSDEIGERLRAAFQDRGYFAVEVKSLKFKPRDPLGEPKPVTVEAEAVEGPKYRVADITFLENHALSTGELREQFPLKKGDVFERGKVVSGLERLRKLYGSKGFVDFFCTPETDPASNGTMTLKVTIVEGKQYHMGKLEILAGKEQAARLRAEWKMAEGSIYDADYVGKFIEEHSSLIPDTVSRQEVFNCPDSLVDVTLTIDPPGDEWKRVTKSVPCESDKDKAK